MKLCVHGSLSGTLSPIYRENSEQSFTVSHGVLTNSTKNKVSANFCVAGPGETASQSNALLWGYILDANGQFEFGSGLVIMAGHVAWANCSRAGAISFRLSGDHV